MITLKTWVLCICVSVCLRGLRTDEACVKEDYDYIIGCFVFTFNTKRMFTAHLPFPCILLFGLLYQVVPQFVPWLVILDAQGPKHVILGIGSAGSAITGRLSEDPNVKVLALEAGEKAEAFADMPFFSKITLISHMTWRFFTTKQEACCKVFKNQKAMYIQGKALGGSSAVNDLQYTRGCKRDYDAWAEQGNEGWSHDDVMKYFLKLEDYRVPHSPYDAKYHSKGGPISVESGKARTPIADAIVQGGFELGYPKIDVNGEFIVGFSNSVQNTRDGSRCSAYTGYVEPALNRSNLRIEAGALVTKILFDENKKAIGVTYMKNGQFCNVTAKKEVIVSAGAINSPKLLMLSGIGPEDTLKKHKIPIVHAAAGVGQNFQDHVVLLFPVPINQSITYSSLFNIDNVKLWRKSKTGPLTNAFGIEGMGYFSSGLSSHPEDWPDLELFFISDGMNGMAWMPYFDQRAAAALTPSDVPNSISITVILQRPKSRGSVTLLSSNFEHPPVIDPAYLTHEDDVNVLVKGIEKMIELVNTKAFQQYGARVPDVISPFCDKKSLSTPDYHKCLVRSVSTAGYHASGTCKMGPQSDPKAVVDDRLRVHGVKGLRVADSSIMPSVLVTHINIPCMMIGEKAADMIKQDNQ